MLTAIPHSGETEYKADERPPPSVAFLAFFCWTFADSAKRGAFFFFFARAKLAVACFFFVVVVLQGGRRERKRE